MKFTTPTHVFDFGNDVIQLPCATKRTTLRNKDANRLGY